MIIRIRGSEGVVRINVTSDQTTLLDIKTRTIEEYKEKLGVDVDRVLKFSLAAGRSGGAQGKRQKLSGLDDDDATVATLGLRHGDMLEATLSINNTTTTTTSNSNSSNTTDGDEVTPSLADARTPSMLDLLNKQRRAKCPSHGPNGSCVRCMEKSFVKLVASKEPHTSGVSFSAESARAFQDYAMNHIAFSVVRYGVMYGRVDPDTGWIHVEAIYEPPQKNTDTGVTVVGEEEYTTAKGGGGMRVEEGKDERELANTIASLLGWRVVGHIYSHTTECCFNVSTSELLRLAREQISLQDSPKGDQPTEEAGVKELSLPPVPFVAATVSLLEDGTCELEVFEVSDHLLRLVHEDRVFVNDDEEVLEESKLSAGVFLGANELDEVDNDVFLVPVPIKNHEGLLHCSFPIENRVMHATLTDVKTALVTGRGKNESFKQTMSDFHMLLFLSKALGVQETGPLVVEVGGGKHADGPEALVRAVVDSM